MTLCKVGWSSTHPSARNAHLSAGTGQSRQTMTAFLRRQMLSSAASLNYLNVETDVQWKICFREGHATRIKWPDTGSKTFHIRNQRGAYTEQCANQRPWNVSEIQRLVAMAGEITISNMKLNFELNNWSDYQQGELYEGKEFITRVTMQPESGASSDQMSAANQWAKHFTYRRAAPWIHCPSYTAVTLYLNYRCQIISLELNERITHT